MVKLVLLYVVLLKVVVSQNLSIMLLNTVGKALNRKLDTLDIGLALSLA